MPSFPLSVEQFSGRLRRLESSFVPEQANQQTRFGGGEIITARGAAPYWTGAFTTALRRGREGAYLRSVVNLLRREDASFLMYDKSHQAPRLDPRGAIIANRVMTLSAVDTDRIRIGNYPSGSQLWLVPDDMLSFTYGENPVRYALHQVAPEADSYGYAGGGLSEWIPVHPRVRPGAVVGAVVTLHRPVCKAVIVTDSIEGGNERRGGLFDPLSFEWRQTLA